MFVVSGCRLAVGLDRRQLWSALVQKARDPLPFVPAITACNIVSRGREYLIRDIVLRGDAVRERVTFEPYRAVRFERLRGPVKGSIVNRIENGPCGALQLRFTFQLAVDGLVPGSAAEEMYARRMEQSYLTAVRTTLATARELARMERLQPAGVLA